MDFGDGLAGLPIEPGIAASLFEAAEAGIVRTRRLDQALVAITA